MNDFTFYILMIMSFWIGFVMGIQGGNKSNDNEENNY